MKRKRSLQWFSAVPKENKVKFEDGNLDDGISKINDISEGFAAD